jgi:hypothetical protein
VVVHLFAVDRSLETWETWLGEEEVGYECQSQDLEDSNPACIHFSSMLGLEAVDPVGY